jgi:hypothetical protein
MSEDFESQLAALDDTQVKRPQQQQKQRLQSNSRVLRSLKKPLEIQVIEEMEDEEASVNPYGNQISPGAMAGDNFKF